MDFIKWIEILLLMHTFRLVSGLFWLPHLKQSIARQDTDCERETVTFNSNFLAFVVAFLGVDQSECACEDPCPANAAKYVKLYLYRKETNTFQRLYSNGSNSYLIDHSRPTSVFVHGFSDSFQPKRNSWHSQLARLESQILDRNTIVLDWGKLSRCPYRAATEYYVPEIGYQLYRMLYALKLDLRSLNCIGHSLGSHICGYAGAASGGQFQRCFGLDPAGIGYSIEYDGPPRGLNRTCCQYVQAIHTDHAIGSQQAMGHVDFFPNNQTGYQPHCLIQTTGCAHQSVVEYYKSALDVDHHFVGTSCGRLRKSSPNAACRFGPHTTTDCLHGSFCFDTAPCAPFVYYIK